MGRRSRNEPTPRVEVGTLIEVPTSRGLAYAQCTALHPVHGPLLRVIEGYEQSRPANLADIAQRTTAFVAFVAVLNGLRTAKFKAVGQHPVPQESRPFPLFRHAVYRPGTNNIVRWQLWDGERSYPVDQLTPAQMDLPLLEIVFPSEFVRRVDAGWRPKDEPVVAPVINSVATETAPKPTSTTARFFFFAPDEAATRSLELELRGNGFEAEGRAPDDGSDWMVVASRRIAGAAEIAALRPRLESLASSVGGEYDGWEYEV